MIAVPTVIIACLLADMFSCNTISLSNVRLVALSVIMFGASICQGFCLLVCTGTTDSTSLSTSLGQIQNTVVNCSYYTIPVWDGMTKILGRQIHKAPSYISDVYLYLKDIYFT